MSDPLTPGPVTARSLDSIETALRQLGLSDETHAAWNALTGGTGGLARVVSTQRGRWLVAGHVQASGAQHRGLGLPESPAALSGRLLEREAGPVTGDWVALRAQDGPSSIEIIEAILPRRSCLSREAAGGSGQEQLLAANVDTVLCAMAVGQNFNPSRMERYLSMAWDSGARPVLVITKIDAALDEEAVREEMACLAQGLPFVLCSSLTGQGLDELLRLLEPGTTAVLAGSSGVGKSTLLNALAGRDLMATGEVSGAVHKGRHTTVGRELFQLPSGAMLIDTPGMRELALVCEEGAIDSAFTDVEALARGCRFADCTHASEPGCAIREAVALGHMDGRRLKNWQKLQREAERQRVLASAAKPKQRRPEKRGAWRREAADD